MNIHQNHSYYRCLVAQKNKNSIIFFSALLHLLPVLCRHRDRTFRCRQSATHIPDSAGFFVTDYQTMERVAKTGRERKTEVLQENKEASAPVNQPAGFRSEQTGSCRHLTDGIRRQGVDLFAKISPQIVPAKSLLQKS